MSLGVSTPALRLLMASEWIWALYCGVHWKSYGGPFFFLPFFFYDFHTIGFLFNQELVVCFSGFW